MVLCAVCKESVLVTQKRIRCSNSKCAQQFHNECIAFSDSPTLRSKWVCPSCITNKPKVGDNSNRPIQSKVMKANEQLPNFNELSNDSSVQPLTLDNIEKLLNRALDQKLSGYLESLETRLKNELTSIIRNEIDELKSDFTITTDFLQAKQSELKCDLDQARTTIHELEKQLFNLSNEVNVLNKKIIHSEKLSRSHNVEIQCVPEKRSENLITLIKKLCEVISFPISDAEIIHCRRVAKMNPSSSRPRNILLSLPTPRHRDIMISAVRRYNKHHAHERLSTRHLDSALEQGPIFVTEHLSPENKALHAATRKFAKENSYAYVWVKNGLIYLRKDDKSGAINVKDSISLEKLR